jgi:hypothetical protein
VVGEVKKGRSGFISLRRLGPWPITMAPARRGTRDVKTLPTEIEVCGGEWYACKSTSMLSYLNNLSSQLGETRFVS